MSIFFKVLFRTHDLHLHCILLPFLLQFTFVSYLVLSTFTSFYLHLQNTLLYFTFTFHKQTTRKKGRDIIPDIFNKVLNRAFWRQNYSHF
jgi:hypothetical protein